eukprot:TRINITY_DN88856_c0_g1_i1.p2 TRINITY_DN88856_c0_g1~~TRINITY_DN88856_c0_g1_i1.p2  ORF type:complete len:367 (+),score=83.33 TRINITY_DN88856_c0_g1_i1:1564-2664(+)
MKTMRDRQRQPVILGLADRIAAGIRQESAEAKDVFLKRLGSMYDVLTGERLPAAVSASLPSWKALQHAVESAGLSARSFAAMAASGQRLQAIAKTAEELAEEARAASFDFGGETPEGRAQAAKLEQAALAGDRQAMFQLGVMFYTANGVDKDEVVSYQWIRRAAELGKPEAQNCVGTFLRNAIGCALNKEEAAAWFQKAADAMDPEAQYNLAEMLFDGEITQDEERAVPLFEASAQQGIALAQYRLGIALRLGQGAERDMRRGTDWVRLAAEQGCLEALREYGRWQYNGDGVPRDIAGAAKSFQRAAEQGDAWSQYNLGLMLNFGDEGVPQDETKAQYWFRQAAAQGLVEAQAQCSGQPLLQAKRE